MTAIILDTETTGFDEPEVIQLAYTNLIEAPDFDVLPEITCRYYKPSKPIALGALATHHILDEDLQDAEPWPGRFDLAGVDYVIGHSIDFDWHAIGSPPWKRICTLALARSIWPTLDSHSLGACIYHVMSRRDAKAFLKNAHDASVDVGLTWRLLNAISDALPPEVATWEDLWQVSEIARVPKIMPFGKHKGAPIEDVPPDYKRWLLGQSDVDPYLVKALRA